MITQVRSQQSSGGGSSWIPGNYTTVTTALTTTAVDLVPAVASPTAPRFITIINDAPISTGALIYVLIGTGTVSSANYSYALDPGYSDDRMIYGDKISAIAASGTQSVKTLVATGVKI